MKFCINTLMLSKEMSILDKIKIAGRSGFDGIEPWVDDFISVNPNDVKKCCLDYGISIPTIIQISGWFENDGGLMGIGDNHQEIIEECKRRMEIAVSIGCGWIIAMPSFSHRGKVSDWNLGVEYFHELLQIGKQIGCMPTIEFMGQTGLINNYFTCKKFIDEFGDDAKMVIDSYHLWRGGGSVDDFLKIDKSQVSVFHISDADKSIDREKHMDRNRVMPMDGKIDLKKFADNVKKIGFDGFVNIGVYNQKLWSINPLELCVDSIRRLRELFL